MTDHEKTKAELLDNLIDRRFRQDRHERGGTRVRRAGSETLLSPEGYRGIFEKAAEGIMVTEASTRRILTVNPELCRMFGYGREELQGLKVEKLHPAEATDRVKSWFELRGREGGSEFLEVTCLRADGGTFRAELRVSRTSINGTPHVVGFFIDITNRRRVEHLVEVQRDLVQTLSATNDLDDALAVCLRTVIEASQLDSGGIFLVEPRSGDLDLVCSEGMSREFVRTIAHCAADSPSARLVASGTPVYLDYEQLSQSTGNTYTRENLKAIAVVPISHDGRVIACLNLASHIETEVSPLARTTIEAIAASIGSAIVRLRAERAERESDSRFRELTELLPLTVFELDDNGYVTYANRHAFESMGYRPADVDGGIHMMALVAPEDYDRAWEQFRRILSGEVCSGLELSVMRRDGTKFAAIINKSRIVRDGRPVGTRGVVVDITERKKVETALKESEERWQFALEGSGDGVWDWNVPTNEVIYSRQWKQMLGYSENEIASSLEEWSTRVHPDDSEAVHVEVRRHLQGETPLYISEHRLRCKDGSYKWILDRGKVINRSPDGKPLRIIGTHTDITERKNAEAELSRTKAFLAAAIEQSAAGILISEGAGGHIRVANPAALDIHGEPTFTPEAPPGRLRMSNWTFERPNGEPFPAEEMPLEQAQRFGRILRNVEAVVCRKDGARRQVLINAAPVRDNEGMVIAGVSVFSDVTEKRQAEEELREREARLSGIMVSAPIGIGIVSNRVLQHVNNAFCAMVGYTESELVGHSVAMLYLTGEEFDRVGREYQRMSVSISSAIETMWRRKDGRCIEVILSVTPLDRQDWSKGITFTALDITERKRAERNLRAAEEQYRVLFERAGEGIMVSRNDYFQFANPAFCALTGLSADELMTSRIADFIHPDHREMVMDRYRRRLSGEDVPTGYEFKILTKTGETKWVRINSTVITWKGERVTLNFLEDITARRASREEILKFKTISDNAPYGTVIVDLSGNFLYVNEAFARMHDYTREELVGRNLSLLHSEEQLHALVGVNEGLIEAGSFTSMEVLHRRRDGTEFPTLMNGVLLKDESGRPQFMAATIADITELKKLQEFADRARRLEAAGRIAGQVAHDFNNLLGPLVAYPEFIREEIGVNHSANDYLDAMESAALQMADINQQLLSMGRRGHYNMEPVNLNEIVRQVLEQSRLQLGEIAVSAELADDVMNIKAGTAQIVRVFTNLISNAVDAMPSRGRLTVTTRNWYADNPRGAFGQIPRGEYVKAIVSDTGCGIPAKLLSQVFEPFFTTKRTDKKRGSGLGLSVVHAIIDDHGGFIDIDSHEGQGTSVFLYFPITREEAPTLKDSPVVGGTETILLVDDDRVQQEVTVRLLRKLGYHVATVDSGKAAVERMNDQACDLLLLDMIMPGGMDGVETYRQILEKAPGQKAIIVSGFAEEDRVAEARRLGAGEFLKKPLTLQALAQAVRRELERVPELLPA